MQWRVAPLVLIVLREKLLGDIARHEKLVTTALDTKATLRNLAERYKARTIVAHDFKVKIWRAQILAPLACAITARHNFADAGLNLCIIIFFVIAARYHLPGL